MKHFISILMLCLAALPGWAQEATPLPSPAAAAASPAPSPRRTPYQPKVEPIEVPPPVQLPPVPAPADVPNKPLSADEACRIALHHQASLQVTAQQVVAAQGRTDAQRSALVPHLNVGGTYTDIVLPANTLALLGTSFATGNFASGGGGGGFTNFNANSTQLTATVRQLLFDFGHTRDLVHQDEELEKAAEANLTKAQLDLVYQVKQAYYQYEQDNRIIKVDEDNLKNRREHLRQAQSRFAGGLGLPADVTRAQTAVAEAVSNTTQAQGNATIDRYNLNVLMGLDPRTPILTESTGEPELPLDNPESLFKAALAQRPELVRQQANIRANEHAVSAAETTSAPSGTANLGYLARFQEGTPQINSITLTASISWDIWDGGLQAGRTKEAEANLEGSKAQLTVDVKNVLNDVATAFVNLRTAEQRLKTTRLQEEEATETVRLNTGRYRVGLGIFLDVLDAQTALLLAQTNRVNAEAQVNLARSALVHAMGQPLPPLPGAAPAPTPTP